MTVASVLARLRNESGAAVVEFALVLPLILVLIFGIIDMGRLLFTANALTSAVREGARYAAVQTNPTRDAVYDRIRNHMDAAVRPPVARAEVSLVANSADRTVIVSVSNYEFSTITPFANLVGLGTIRLNPSATLRWERAP